MNGNLLTPAEIFQQAVISSGANPVSIFNIVKTASALNARVTDANIIGIPKDKASAGESIWGILKQALGADMVVPMDRVNHNGVPTSVIFGVRPDSPWSFLICIFQEIGDKASLVIATGNKDVQPCVEQLKELFVEE